MFGFILRLNSLQIRLHFSKFRVRLITFCQSVSKLQFLALSDWPCGICWIVNNLFTHILYALSDSHSHEETIFFSMAIKSSGEDENNAPSDKGKGLYLHGDEKWGQKYVYAREHHLNGQPMIFWGDPSAIRELSTEIKKSVWKHDWCTCGEKKDNSFNLQGLTKLLEFEFQNN